MNGTRNATGEVEMNPVGLQLVIDAFGFDSVHMDEIWHYTDLAALNSISKESKIRLTDFRFLNDSKEVFGAIEYLKAKAKDVFRTEKGRRAAKVIADLCVKHINSEDVWIFVASFTELKDSIPMWMAYCGKASGACVGIDSKEMNNFLVYDLKIGAFASKVLYSPSEKDDLYRRYAESWEKQLLAGTDIDQLGMSLTFFFYSCCTHFKDEAWSGEKEVRIAKNVLRQDLDPEIKYKIRDAFAIPYIEIPIYGDKPSIHNVIVLNHDANNAKSVASMLRKNGVDCKVSRTTTNLRLF